MNIDEQVTAFRKVYPHASVLAYRDSSSKFYVAGANKHMYGAKSWDNRLTAANRAWKVFQAGIQIGMERK